MVRLMIKSETSKLRRMSSPNLYACTTPQTSKTKRYAMSSVSVGIRESTFGKMKRKKLLRHSKHFLKTTSKATLQI